MRKFSRPILPWRLRKGSFANRRPPHPLPGWQNCIETKALQEGETVVCTLTGHGLKDADTAIGVSKQPQTVKATREDVARSFESLRGE